LHDSERHEFWPDSVSYTAVPLGGVLGHRQVTDAYLAHLARTYDGRLATFDRGLAKLHTDVADLLAVGGTRP
jgi:predicted nucleic acid-binding protein